MQLLQDVFIIENLQVLEEGQKDGKMRIRGTFQRAEEANNNGRVYPKAVLEGQLNKIQPLITERRLCGELDHPQNDTVKLSNASHLITKLEMKGNEVIGEAEILKTPAGMTAQALVNGGVKIGISSRGMGTLSEDAQGAKIVNEDFKLVTFDLVADPSTRGAYPGLSESTQGKFVRETESKLKKESNFLTMLESKMKEAYKPWIDEGRSSRAMRQSLTKKQASELKKQKQDTKHSERKPNTDASSTQVHDHFELVKQDGGWHRIAEAIAAAMGHEISEISSNVGASLLTKDDPAETAAVGGKGVGIGASERLRGLRKHRKKSANTASKMTARDTVRQARATAKANRITSKGAAKDDVKAAQISARGAVKATRRAEKDKTGTARIKGQQTSRRSFEKTKQKETGNMGIGGEVRHGIGKLARKAGLRSVQQADASDAAKAKAKADTASTADDTKTKTTDTASAEPKRSLGGRLVDKWRAAKQGRKEAGLASRRQTRKRNDAVKNLDKGVKTDVKKAEQDKKDKDAGFGDKSRVNPRLKRKQTLIHGSQKKNKQNFRTAAKRFVKRHASTPADRKTSLAGGTRSTTEKGVAAAHAQSQKASTGTSRPRKVSDRGRASKNPEVQKRLQNFSRLQQRRKHSNTQESMDQAVYNAYFLLAEAVYLKKKPKSDLKTKLAIGGALAAGMAMGAGGSKGLSSHGVSKPSKPPVEKVEKAPAKAKPPVIHKGKGVSADDDEIGGGRIPMPAHLKALKKKSLGKGRVTKDSAL